MVKAYSLQVRFLRMLSQRMFFPQMFFLGLLRKSKRKMMAIERFDL
jgi:hypothetical protein